MIEANSSTEPLVARSDVSTIPRYKRIDHVAFAVRDLESAIRLFEDVLGFTLVRRLQIRGSKTGMISAEFEHNDIKFVLCQGTEPESQVSQLIEHHGPGVAHIALEVEDPRELASELQERGLAFDTSVIEGPGLIQVFSARCANSGASFEFICRTSEQGFLEENVQQLFEQLESSGKY